MPEKQIKRKCGHIENIYLKEQEINNPAALKHHEDELCERCYVSTNCVYEKRMPYVDYRNEYILCRIKVGSYDEKTKRLLYMYHMIFKCALV